MDLEQTSLGRALQSYVSGDSAIFHLATSKQCCQRNGFSLQCLLFASCFVSEVVGGMVSLH